MTAPLAADQVRRLRAQGEVRLVDVRSPGEFASLRIPGSVNVPLDVLRTHRGTWRAEHGDTVVLLCASGTRATQARDEVAGCDLARVEVLDGGVNAWVQAGHDVQRGGGGAWAMERQVRLTAGSLVLAGVLGSLRYRPAVALAGAIGAGLTFSAVTDTCGMARVLALLPRNRRGAAPPDEALARLAR